MDDNKIAIQPVFLLSIPVLIALSRLFTEYNLIDIAYLVLVAVIFGRHYFRMKKEK